MELVIRDIDVIETTGSTLLKFIDDSRDDFSGFGEVYSCKIGEGVDRGWKIHALATCNVMVPVGSVTFVVSDFDMRTWSFQTIGNERMKRLVIPPYHWYRFIGESKPYSLITNLMSIAYKDEAESPEQIALNALQAQTHVIWGEKRLVGQ